MDPKVKWNTKYNERLAQQEEPVANSRLKNLSTYLNGGKALDIACGLGGNSVFLARKNYQVQALDISEVAVSYLTDQALKQKLTIDPQVCDLTSSADRKKHLDTYDLIVITYYLDRTLFPLLKKVVNKNGYFFMETYYQSPQTVNESISNYYKLKPKELLTVFSDWKVLYYEENEQEGRQTIFCQK